MGVTSTSVANQVDASELTPEIKAVVANMDVWLAARCAHDKNLTLANYISNLFN